MSEAILVIVAFVAVAAGVRFLLSLMGRVTNTTYVTRGGTRIEPYKTLTERKVVKEQEQFARDVDQLNFFCSVFAEKKIDPFATKYGLSYQNPFSINLPSGVPSEEASRIIARGNLQIALKHHASLNSMKEDGLIDFKEYLDRGKDLYKKLSGISD